MEILVLQRGSLYLSTGLLHLHQIIPWILSGVTSTFTDATDIVSFGSKRNPALGLQADEGNPFPQLLDRIVVGITTYIGTADEVIAVGIQKSIFIRILRSPSPWHTLGRETQLHIRWA